METTFSGGTPKFSQSGFLQVLTWISWTGGGTRGRSVRRGALLPRFGFLSSEEDICFTTTSPEPLDSGEYQPRNIRISPTLVNGLGSTSGAFSLPLCFPAERSEEHTSELQSLMRISYAVFCLKKTNKVTTSQQDN